MLEKVWTSQADFEGGTLTNLWVPEGLNRLEPKRLTLSGTGVWIFDGGAGRKFNWQSFQNTKPNQNIYYRDDFRDNSLEAWTIIAGTWAGYDYYLKGTGNLDWGSNRIEVGSISWEGLDALFKGYKAGGEATDPDHRFYFRATSGADVKAYGWLLSSGGNVSAFRVDAGDILDNIDKGVASPSKDVWYWFRVQIYTSGGNVIQRIKWWLIGNEEPGEWNVSHTWTWCSPTSFSDGGGWSNETLIYDNNTTTYCYCDKNTIPTGGYGNFLQLNIAALQSGKIQTYTGGSFDGANDYLLDIDVYRDGGWVDVYEGHLGPNKWDEKTFTPGSVTAARIRCKNPPGRNNSYSPGVFEVQLEGVWRSAGCFNFGRHTSAGENRYDNILLSRQEGIPSPANCSVSFKFWASNDGSTWGSEYTEVPILPNSRFIKIQATLTRTSLLSAMPTIEDMTLGYKLLSQPIFI